MWADIIARQLLNMTTETGARNAELFDLTGVNKLQLDHLQTSTRTVLQGVLTLYHRGLIFYLIYEGKLR